MAQQPAIPRRQLGNTGLQVSVLGFGASPLGGVFEAIDESAGVAAVHEAFRLGINFFDTSPFYGATKSETVLGKGLAALPRDQIIVATKVGRYGEATFNFSSARVTASVRESLARLGTGYIDLIQVHDMEFGDLDEVVSETLPALAALKAEGLVRFIGITGLPLRNFRYVLDRAPAGSVDVILSYCHYCLNDTSLEAQLPYLQSKGVGVISASPLCMGLLTPQGPPVWHPAPPALRAAAAAAVECCAARGVDLPRAALKFAVKQPGIQTTLVGMASVEVVHSNVAAVLEALVSPGGSTPPDETPELMQELAAVFSAVKDLTWPSGRPENN